MSGIQFLVAALCVISSSLWQSDSTTLHYRSTRTIASRATTPYPETVFPDWTRSEYSQPPQLSTASPQPFCSRQYSCIDCQTARVCAPTPDGLHLKQIAQITCPSNNPWCDPERGVCTSTMTPGCATPPHEATDFICMRDGYFPSMTNCSRYYLCRGGAALEYTCPEPSPYYHTGYQECVKYNYYCANNTDVCSYGYVYKRMLWNTYPLYNLFVYCANGLPVAVDRCIGAYQFDDNQERCLPHCPYAGLFPGDDDCADYYRCSPATSPSLTATSFVMTNLTCPQGQGFLESAYQCVDRSLVPNCIENNPGLFNKK